MDATTENGELSVNIDFTVPFYDLDAIQMVWHGNYVKYMENAREAFGDKYHLLDKKAGLSFLP